MRIAQGEQSAALGEHRCRFGIPQGSRDFMARNELGLFTPSLQGGGVEPNSNPGFRYASPWANFQRSFQELAIEFLFGNFGLPICISPLFWQDPLE